MSAPTQLSTEEYVRLNSWALIIAGEARGHAKSDGSGNWRFGHKGGLCVYANGQFHDFSGGAREHGHGAFQLIEHLYPTEDAVAWARDWLHRHSGNGSFTAAESEPVDDFAEAEATAYINSLYNGAAPIDDTLGYIYIVKTRGVPLRPEDQAQLRWIANFRADEGALIAPVTDGEGQLVKLLLTFVTPDGRKSPYGSGRYTIRGAKRPGLYRLGSPGPKVTETEGLEKGLAARAAGAEYVVVCGGAYSLGKVPLPPEVQSDVIARDADPPGSPSDLALWRGVALRLGQGLKVAVTARPNDIAPKEAPPLKDIDDVWRYDPELASILLNGANLEHGRLGEAADGAILDLASRLDAVALGRARKGVAQLLGIPLSALDDELDRRVRDRKGERPVGPRGALGPAPWEDPVTDIAAVLDASVRCMKKYMAAPDIYFNTVALWILHAHLIHREELGIDVTPRLGFQSPEEDSGKTTFMKTVREQVPRPKGTGSLSSSALFRAVHDRKVTFLVDEGDMVFHPNASPDLFAIFNSGNDRAFASVTRSVPLGDGQFEDQDFNTFGALCFTSIDKLWLRSSQSRCIGLPMRPATQKEAAGLARFRTNRDQELKDCGRKMARWAMDLPELPDIDVPDNFVNRIADNWRCLFQIAYAAGGDWPARILAAAQADADGYGDSEGRAERGANGLLDAIWRVFAAETTDPRRLHTEVLIEKLLNLDDGRWRVANKGKAIDAYYFRTKLKNYVTPQSKKADDSKDAEDKMPPREWRSPKGQNKNGYHELHFADPFRRYLGRGLPSEAGTDPSPLDPSSSSSSSTSYTSTTSTTEAVYVDISKAYPVVDSADDRGSASPAKRTPDDVGDGHPRSSASSTTEKTEQIVGVEPGVVDVVDAWGTDREKVKTEVHAAERLPRGPVGRKRQKG